MHIGPLLREGVLHTGPLLRVGVLPSKAVGCTDILEKMVQSEGRQGPLLIRWAETQRLMENCLTLRASSHFSTMFW